MMEKAKEGKERNTEARRMVLLWEDFPSRARHQRMAVAEISTLGITTYHTVPTHRHTMNQVQPVKAILVKVKVVKRGKVIMIAKQYREAVLAKAVLRDTKRRKSVARARAKVQKGKVTAQVRALLAKE
jgi:hypothetical protein